MTSSNLLLVLMAAAVYAAPQMNQREVVGSVLAQLQPAIHQALGELNLGSPPSSFPSATFPSSTFTPSSSPSFPVSHSHIGSSPHFTSSGSPRFTSVPVASPRFYSAPSSRLSSRMMTSSMFSPRTSSGMSSKMITSQVVSQLQPAVTAAVSEALADSSRESASLWSGPWVAPLGALNSPTAPISRTYVPTRRLTQQPVTSLAPSEKSAIVSSVLRNLRPKITSVVRSALASSRPAPASTASTSLTGLFGTAGENNVRIHQAGNTIEY